MPRLFVSNFEFEHELAGVVRKGTQELSQDLSAAWIAIAEPGDAISGFGETDAGFADELARIGRAVPGEGTREELQSVPWGWTDSVRGLAPHHPAANVQDAVRTVNSRRFSFALEDRLGCGLDSSAMVTDVSAFSERARDLFAEHGGWVVKAEFSMSSRERIVARRSATEADENWVQKRLVETGAIFIEPLVNIQGEAAAQFDVESNGATLCGLTGLLTTDAGRFGGCWIWPGATGDLRDFCEAEEALSIAVREAGAAGYRGPLGIDMAKYSSLAEGGLRPLQDINARYTMGRLALGFRDVMDADEHGAWLFVPWKRSGLAKDFVARCDSIIEPDVRMVRTAPYSINQRETQLGTLLLVSKNQTSLRRSCSRVFEVCGRRLRLW